MEYVEYSEKFAGNKHHAGKQKKILSKSWLETDFQKFLAIT